MSRKTAATGAPSSSSAAAIAASWFGPPSPKAASRTSVTVLSPPQPSMHRCRRERSRRRRRCGGRGWRAACRSGAPRPRGSVETTTGLRPARSPRPPSRRTRSSPVTRTTVWIASGSSSRRLGVAPRRCSRIDGGARVPEAVAVEDRDRVVGSRAVRDARVGDRVDVIAGDVGDREVDQARGRRRRRQATALDRRDVLADRVDLDDPACPTRAAARAGRASRRRDPAGGRLASAELPPVKQAITRSRWPRDSAIASRRAGGGRARVARQRMVGAEQRRPARGGAARRGGRRSPRRRAGRRGSPPAPTAIPMRRLAGADDERRARRGRAGGGRRRRSARRRQRDRPRSPARRASQAVSPAARDRSVAARLALARCAERPVELEQARPGRRGGGSRVAGQGLAQADDPPGRDTSLRDRRPCRRAPRRSASAGCTWRCARRGPARRS